MKTLQRFATIAILIAALFTARGAQAQTHPSALGECGVEWILNGAFILQETSHWDWVVMPFVKHYDVHCLLELETYMDSGDPLHIYPPTKHYFITQFYKTYHDFSGPVNVSQYVNLLHLWDDTDVDQYYLALTHWRLHISISIIDSQGYLLDYDEHYTQWIDEYVALNPYPVGTRTGD